MRLAHPLAAPQASQSAGRHLPRPIWVASDRGGNEGLREKRRGPPHRCSKRSRHSHRCWRAKHKATLGRRAAATGLLLWGSDEGRCHSGRTTLTIPSRVGLLCVRNSSRPLVLLTGGCNRTMFTDFCGPGLIPCTRGRLRAGRGRHGRIIPLVIRARRHHGCTNQKAYKAALGPTTYICYQLDSWLRSTTCMPSRNQTSSRKKVSKQNLDDQNLATSAFNVCDCITFLVAVRFFVTFQLCRYTFFDNSV